jgi:glycosyltransferase involved in cell wall biosynthesis
MASLSVCMIVKNEERFLADCLKSVQGVAQQIVIVDTGSTDNTLKIAQSFNAEIHSFTWRDDFSAARNESIKWATGDWVLWLDADERLLPESVSELKRLLKTENKPVAYVVQIRNRMPDGKNYKFSTAHRLFTNRKGITFSGRIHEQIAYSVAALGGVERSCNVTLDHLGYALEESAQNKKSRRNRKL